VQQRVGIANPEVVFDFPKEKILQEDGRKQ
jgi:hypothetical protein